MWFEAMSKLKINLEKSKMILVGQVDDVEKSKINLYVCIYIYIYFKFIYLFYIHIYMIDNF